MCFSFFKSSTHTPPASQSSITGTPSSSIVAIIECSENHTSGVIDQTAVAQAIVSQSEKVRSTTTPSNTPLCAGSAITNALKFSLQHLGKALVPSIGVATVKHKETTQIRKDINETVAQLHIDNSDPRYRIDAGQWELYPWGAHHLHVEK